MPSTPPKSHSFVVRIRLEDAAAAHRPVLTAPADGAPPERRLHIRIEHVDGGDARGDIGQHTTIPDALAWLEARMQQLFPQRPAPLPPSAQT